MDRRNNFDALRLVAAVSVIFSHSFLIAEGTQNNEPLILSDRQPGDSRSCRRLCILRDQRLSGDAELRADAQPAAFSREARAAHLSRPVRRHPGLGLCLGADRHRSAARRLFEPAAALRIRRSAIRCSITRVHELPGVWFADNQIGLEINGSLWTLRSEFLMYLMVLGLGVLRLLTLRVALAAAGFRHR